MSRRTIFGLIPVFLSVLLICNNNLSAQTSSKKPLKAQPVKTAQAPAKTAQAPAAIPATEPITVTKPVDTGSSPLPWLEYLQKIGLALATLILAFLLIKYISRVVILISEKTHILKITTKRLVLIANIWWPIVL
jgi:hypothetical protein